MQGTSSAETGRKILHVDMDCFYAAIEIRDDPDLRGRPVAVGGASQRGVLTTCNYEARKFGCRSAMPTYKAMRLCPDLVVVRTRFDIYRAESRRIRAIFHQFTDLVEPLSLDEAFLDVSKLNSHGAAVASEIRRRIRQSTGLTASAGIAPNKMLAKIASDWRKPDGQFELQPGDIDAFMRELPVRKIRGVGAKTAAKIESMGARTCGELQQKSVQELRAVFGRFGADLFQLCRGLDDREVNPDRERKSLSNERTFRENLLSLEEGLEQLAPLVEELCSDLAAKHANRLLHKAFVKVKFSDFQQTTVERMMDSFDAAIFEQLLREGWARGNGREVRLLGAGVRFRAVDAERLEQLELSL
ncbi:MAG: DNA polymerase IV [Verrucomicrobiota bacterium]